MKLIKTATGWAVVVKLSDGSAVYKALSYDELCEHLAQADRLAMAAFLERYA